MTFFGRLVRKDVKVEHCVDGLPRGIYIVGKKKNTCRQVECQNDKVKDSDARECVISCRIPYGWEITHSRVLSFFLKARYNSSTSFADRKEKSPWNKEASA